MSLFRRVRSLSAWRRVALSGWDSPGDPTAYGTLELDVEAALAYADKVRAASGEKVTLTHVVGKAIAMCIASRPEVNGFVAHGELYVRDSVDVFFQVAFFDDEVGKEGGRRKLHHEAKSEKVNLAGAKIKGCDQKSVVAIAKELRERAEAIRKKGDAETVESANVMAKIPGPLLGPLVRLGAYLSYDMGLDLRRFGIPRDAFGSAMVTNIGVFGLSHGQAPLVPFARVPIVVTLGAVREIPQVVRGQILPRRCMAIGVAFDHRVMDGYHAGTMAKRFRAILEDPERHFGETEAAQPVATA